MGRPSASGAGSVALVIAIFVVEQAELIQSWWLLGPLSVLAAVLFAYAVIAGWREHQRKRTGTTGSLASELENLSQAILHFIPDRTRDESSRVPRKRTWNADTNKMLAYSTETMARYQTQFQVRALALFDEAVKAGAAEPKDRLHFEHPTNPLGIQEVGTRLGVMAKQLRRR